ncbi:hypothetical protein DIU31_031965 [Mucilaginibacter rubeus]|uniref:Uncharacterized protein n=1 Tax=Mucilaginibacter rubeus TaxID=2027860 RepID=A0AAE6JLY0_9SPHI|nr:MULTISPECIES: hypothetical protein [Mucilaginibacter]QEM07898.1 hypothetical protein DIU31_031965 [Mucilaginibacter rubeus]QEM20350.1 hypothetical protein DIU38_031570 [Mucilaginibacter gossypii]QTE42930.1 hypothetical protein J3L19_29085 [Mucilaginibacter rubeus]QTE49531.1 hypothetical protein J3L21_29045 [Mucilaginibacter rubeus]QTE54627.1 hypothetical protein J3L23_20670 [Mucilaginibacter rubeus]
MHDAIKCMLAGKNVIEPIWFGEKEDMTSYRPYIPALCDLLRADPRKFELFDPAMILMQIMPPDPDAAILTKLLEQLPGNHHRGTSILKMLSNYRIPAEVDISPVLALIGDDYFSTTAIFALRKTFHPEAEEKILPLLREELRHDIGLMKIYCDTLAVNGSILSMPVLMAVSLDFERPEDKEYFTDAIKSICSRLQMPEDIRAQFEDPAFWKLKWEGSPEHFAGFIEFLALFMVSGETEGGKKEDMIAGIFMQEMDVDLSPYQSFEAVRLCSSPEMMMEGLQNLKNNLECNVLMNALTEGTNILPSTYTLAQDLYFDLMNDYLMTRLRRHISFAAES